MKRHTIGEAAEKMNLSAHTLRYYDKEGLLPFVERTENGVRVFKDSDFEWLSIIECLKQTGMPLKDIKQYVDWCLEGDCTLRQRYDMFLERRAEVEKQIAQLHKALEKIDYKCRYYETALDAGTLKVHDRTLERQALDRQENLENIA